MRLSPRISAQIHSPIGEAFAMVQRRGGKLDLLDLSQAAPSHPCAPEVADHIAGVAASPDGGRYCPQEGLAHLREAFADDLTATGIGNVDAADVLVTAGCNQAFCLTVSALCDPGDEVVLVVPFYFNHDMWLRLQGFVPRYVDQATAAAIEPVLGPNTRAVVLVSPANPTGHTTSPVDIEAIYDLCANRGVVLMLDETYRSFRPTDEAPHTLHQRPDWRDHLVTLHSFSKEFAIPGYRVGAVVAGRELTTEAMKLLDCVAICAPRIGQEAAWAGLTMADEWRRQQTARVRERQVLFETVMADRPGGFTLQQAGAYFGWVSAPDGAGNTAQVVEQLIVEHDVLTIPGTAFTPTDQRMLRMSFANLTESQIGELGERLTGFTPHAG